VPQIINLNLYRMDLICHLLANLDWIFCVFNPRGC
jgi:hypothetical protein